MAISRAHFRSGIFDFRWSDRELRSWSQYFSFMRSSLNPKSKICSEQRRTIGNPKPVLSVVEASLPPLLQHFFYEFSDRFLVHPVGAIDERIAIGIRLRPAVSL